jgi:hypothetical protein
MKDANGREIQIGGEVVHSEAKFVVDWLNPKYDFPKMKGGRKPMSAPFPGPAKVMAFIGSTCVRCKHPHRANPVHLACFLEVVA